MEYSDYLFTLLFNEYYLNKTKEPYDEAYPLMLELKDKFSKSRYSKDESISEYDAMCNFLGDEIKNYYVNGQCSICGKDVNLEGVAGVDIDWGLIKGDLARNSDPDPICMDCTETKSLKHDSDVTGWYLKNGESDV